MYRQQPPHRHLDEDVRSSLRFRSRKRGPRSAQSRLRRFQKLAEIKNSTEHATSTDEAEVESPSTCTKNFSTVVVEPCFLPSSPEPTTSVTSISSHRFAASTSQKQPNTGSFVDAA